MAGYGWLLERLDNNETLIWHNGGTGGFSTYVGVIPERRLTVGVFSNSAVSVDELARVILLEHDSSEPPSTTTRFQWIIAVVLLAWIIGYILVRALTAFGSESVRKTPSDLLQVGTNITDVTFMISIWARTTPAVLYVPGLEYIFLAAVAAVTATDVVRMKNTGALRLYSSTRPTWRIIAAGIQITLFGSLTFLVW